MVTEKEIEAAKTESGGWTRDKLAEWGVEWPPAKGWKKKLIDQEIIQAACDFYGVSLHDFDARNGKRGTNADRLPVKARRAACKAFYARGYSKGAIARLVGYSGPTPIRYLITGKR